MSIKLLRKYFDYCNDKGIDPTFEGLDLWRKSSIN